MTIQFKKFLIGLASLGMGIVVFYVLLTILASNITSYEFERLIDADFFSLILSIISVPALYYIIKKEYLDK